MRCALVILALVVAAHCAERTVYNSCPKSLLTLESTLYLKVEGNLCYRFVTYSEKVYTDAERACEEDGGNLVMPKSQEINDYLINTLKNSFQSKNPVWIGLNDREEEGAFKWEDGSSLAWNNFDDENGPGNSGTLQKGAEDCVAIHKDGKWHDYQCGDGLTGFALSWLSWSYPQKPYVCQYPAIDLLKEETVDEDDKEDKDPSDNSQETVGGSDDNNNTTVVHVSESKTQTAGNDKDEDKSDKDENIPDDGNDENIPDDGNDENIPEDGNDENIPDGGNDENISEDGNNENQTAGNDKDEDKSDKDENIPDDGNDENIPEDGNDENIPEDGNDENIPDDGNDENIPDDGNNENIPDDGNNENISEDGNNENIDQDDDDKNIDDDKTKTDDDGNTDEGSPGDDSVCGSFHCVKDCGMDGFKIDENGCQICECNV